MTFAVEFDFDARQDREIPLEAVGGACAAGRYCWVDAAGLSPAALAELLSGLGVDPTAAGAIVENDARSSHFNVFQSCLHFSIGEARLRDGVFQVVPVHVVLGPRFLLTVHGGEVETLRLMRQTYHEDFVEHSRSHGFLLFELADHLAHVYRHVLSEFAEQIAAVEVELFGDADDRIFVRVSALIRSLLEFRKTLVAARETLHELATRRSPFIGETTQPFLEKKGRLLERLAADAATEREVLSESLNLYMGIVSYRTNRILDRLTMVATVFLPLGFLAGVYGMNFGAADSTIPEIHWRYGYFAFWAVCGIVALTILGALRWKKLL